MALPSQSTAKGCRAKRTGDYQRRSSPDRLERVLFVDDEKTLAEAGQALLEGLGYKVTVSS